MAYEMTIPCCTNHILVEDTNVIARFFTPDGRRAWYALGSQQMSENDLLLFALEVVFTKKYIISTEASMFLLSDLHKFRDTYGLPPEIDLLYSNQDWRNDIYKRFRLQGKYFCYSTSDNTIGLYNKPLDTAHP